MSDSLGYEYIFKVILAAAAFYTIGMAVIFFVCYIFRSIALYRMASHSNMPHKWLAWVPFFNTSLLTQLGLRNYIIGAVMPVIYLVGIELAGGLDGVWEVVSFQAPTGRIAFGAVLVIAYYIMYIVSSFKVYKTYSRHYIVMTVFSVITFGLTIPFMLFAIRNNQPIYQNV